MSYETGTATDFSDLMSKLITFATSYCGFTYESTFNRTESLSYDGTSTGTSYTIRCLSRGGVYWWFRFTTSNMFCLLSTGTGATWNTIANRSPNDSEVNCLSGTYVYRFFEVDDSLHVALIRTYSGVVSYRHFSFGKIQKYGSWTGGEYFTGSYDEVSGSSYYNTKLSQYHCRLFGNKVGYVVSGNGSAVGSRASYGVIRCTYNSKNYANIDRAYNDIETGMNEAVTMGGLRRHAHVGQTGMSPSIDPDKSPNLWSDTAAATPIHFMLYDNAGASRFLDMGYLTGIRFLNVQNLTPDQLVNTDWRVYPLSYQSETGSANYAASGNMGIAFREVA